MAAANAERIKGRWRHHGLRDIVDADARNANTSASASECGNNPCGVDQLSKASALA
jgi:hypothetical protein